ncbi:BTAD domain-containing putative transcriptional regulator [Actinoplanes sp. DH11]|uniref:BTAD domain-containing putative transcriptional regulator n=1 Tax=Actinoplanes sp. DH11 TaxID=2857011 RepID=UPI0027145006|nr:BTAD domain-containing putative transcriptional regulator [Actinoplanes sp. DH11]
MTDEHVHRKAASYARQNSVWTATTEPSRPRPGKTRRALALLRAMTGVAALTVAPPTLLTWLFGAPAALLPSWDTVTAFVNADGYQPEPAAIVTAVVLLLWALWAVLMLLLAGSLLRIAVGWRIPRWRLPTPLHRLLFGLAGSAAVALIGTPHGGGPASTAPVAATATDTATPGQGALQAGTITVLVGDTQHVYEVKRGDTLSKISRRWLGDSDRWPEICRLNRHHHVATGAKLTDCDLIQPGWELRLPDDAQPPTATRPTPPRHEPEPRATPTTPSTSTPPPAPTPGTSAPPAPSVGAPTTPASPPSTASTGSPSTTVPSPPYAPPPKASPPNAVPSSASASSSPSEAPTGPHADTDGLHLPSGSLIPWALAAALSATAALLWRQHRRRFTPQPGPVPSLPAPPLPEPLPTIQRHSDRDTPSTAALPTGIVGVDGPDAHGIARGLLITALTSGSIDDPQQRAEVIIDRATLTALLGADVTGWSRLHVTGDFAETLTVVDSHLLHRARLLDEHDVTDLAALRDQAPTEEAVPPLLVIGSAADATGRRTDITLGLAEGLDVTTVLLGPWPGHTLTADSDPAPAVITRADALALLDTIREAHTGTPTTTEQPPEPPAPEPSVPASPSTAPADTRAHLRVLGTPRVDDLTRPGNNLRAKAAELGVYLACHPDGADTDAIAEHLLPDVRRRQAAQQVHTNASNLRHVLGRAAGPIQGGYLLKRGAGARYRLDPTTVEVDIWRLRDLLNQAQLASPPARIELLREACELYTAPLADGYDYEWVDPHRERVRQWGIQAHLHLAEDLLPTDPQAASALLDKAITLDRYNEQLYRTAMRARHATGDTDGVRTLLRAVTAALAELDAQPEDETIALSNDLRTPLTK